MFEQFNPYGPPPGAFQPQYTGYPPPTIPMMQPQTPAQPPRQPQQTSFDWIRVNTVEDIKNVSVAPNGQAWIMLSNEPVFAVKSADSMGLASTRMFKFEPYTPSQSIDTSSQSVNQSDYVTIEMYQKMQKDMQEISKELNELKGGMSNGKSAKRSVPAAASGAGESGN